MKIQTHSLKKEYNMKTALISVYNKTGIEEFAQGLLKRGFGKLISSGGTAATLKKAGIPVTDVADISGLSPILGHRVVTLVPQIHGGLLATEEQRAELEELGYPWIDLACVDFYPLIEEIRRPGATRESVIEKTDIGGPTMVRSAIKGRRIVIVESTDRSRVLEWLDAGEPDSDRFKNNLAAKAEGIVANYCLESARFHSEGKIDGMIGYEVAPCKYGENAWQTPAGLFARYGADDPLALQNFKLVAGDALSYNNWCDIDRMLQTITHIAAGFEQNLNLRPFIALAVKHGNPCGAAVSFFPYLPSVATQKAIEGDTLAIFGGSVMTTFEIGDDQAKELIHHKMPEGQKRILDVVVAPSFTAEAIEILSRKHGKCRLVVNSHLAKLTEQDLDQKRRLRFVRGGFLKQPNYTFVLQFSDFEKAEETESEISLQTKCDLLLAWAVGSTSNSNTITLVKDGMLIGNGVGQQDRVGAAQLAIERARRSTHDIKGAVAYSDSFFPFPDGPEVLADAGIKTILASSGSRNDGLIKETCRKCDVALYFVPDVKCRGFFGH